MNPTRYGRAWNQGATRGERTPCGGARGGRSRRSRRRGGLEREAKKNQEEAARIRGSGGGGSVRWSGDGSE
jgi:hypothetical protein